MSESDLHDFIDAGPYYETAGAVCPFPLFVAKFVEWLGDDERIMRWTQSHRIRNALLRGGFPIGRFVALGMTDAFDAYIGNLAGPKSRSVSHLPIVFDPDCRRLMPRDLTESEAQQLRLR